MKWLLIVIALIVAAILVLRALSRIEPVVWQPAPNPGLTGDFAPNDKLSAARLLAEGVCIKPEDVARASDGRLYAGCEDGRIVRFNADGADAGDFVNTAGRPLGMQFDESGSLIVGDAVRGLLQVAPDGTIRVLADEADGTRLRFVDDLDIASDGTIWFSDASQRFGYRGYIYDLIEGSATGRLVSYSPPTGRATERLGNLFFANGVALGPDESYVLVTETGTGRIHRLWLKGDKAGQNDLFMDALPGNPDNMSFNGSDTFWVALPGVRNPAVEALAAKPFIRKLLGALPAEWLKPKSRYGFVVGLRLDGSVKHNLQSPTGHVHTITSVNQYGDQLYMGSIGMDAVIVLPVP